jgi:hypothetical protein
MKPWKAILVVFLVVVPSRGEAAERGGVSMPDTVSVEGANLVLNGLGIRQATIFKVNVYVAGLYVLHKSRDARQLLASDEPKRLHMVFVRDVDRDQVADAFREGFEKNAGMPLEPLRERIDRLIAWMGGFKKGRSATFTYTPDDGVEVAIDGVSKGEIPAADFARALFSLWLGPNPPNDGLKRGLLGGD